MGSNGLFATRAMFLCAGLSMAACASLFPLVKTSVGANDAVMGALLFCLGGGAMVAMPLSGMLVARFGCRLVMVVSICLFSLALSLLPHATSLAQAVALLLVFGADLGATDCIMNIQGAMVEKEHQRNLMSGFHGFYSLGGIVGAGLMVGLLKIGLGPALSRLCSQRLASSRTCLSPWPYRLVSTLGYLGVLAGPALVGQVSNVTSLPFALLSVVGLMIFATLLVFKVRV